MLAAIALLLSAPLTILSPSSRQTIFGTQVTVQVSTPKHSLVDFKLHPRPVPGQGHLLLWLDQTTPGKTSAVKAVSPSYTFANVKPGDHYLLVELVANNNASFSPPATASVTFRTAPASLFTGISQLQSVLVAFLLLTLSLFLLLRTQTKTKK